MHFPTNIKYLRNKKELPQRILAERFNITRGQLASYEDGRAEPSFSTLLAMSNFFKIPIDTLIKHDISTSKDGVFIQLGNNRVLFPIQINENNEDVIEVVPMKASAGYLEGFSDPEFISTLPQLKLPFIPAGKHRAFPIKGDSMEPWVKDGAFIVGKFVEDFGLLKHNQTYIFVTEREGIVYKRLQLDQLKEGLLVFKSDNSFYKNIEVPFDELVEAWEFTCKIDTKDYNDEELNVMSILKMLRGFEVELKDIKRKIK
jgi:transcriptional regulator with XRE-family HTH domain